MKRLFTFILASLLIYCTSLAQTLSTTQLLRAWKTDDTSQTTRAEATYQDLKTHIDTASENSQISFSYWNAWRSVMYQTDAFLNFQVDGNYGTADGPEVLDLQYAKQGK